MSLDDVRKRLVSAGYRLDRLTGMRVNGTNTLRPVKVVYCEGRPKPVTLSGADLRRAIGYSYLFSTRFIIREEPARGEVTFLGSGAGHGVGLCQWGARGMANDGMGYLAILNKYFPGTSLKMAH